MALIKYYNLESKSWEEVSDLERNLQKHLLNEKRIRSLLETDVEEITEAKTGNGDKDTLAMFLYDSGDFDVLYKRAEIKKRKGLFRKAALVGTELVVRAKLGDILELQNYLADSGFEVVEARNVSQAVYTFITKPKSETTVDAGIKVYRRLFSGQEGLDIGLEKSRGYIAGKNGHSLQGSVKGPVVEVLRARNIIRNDGQDLPVHDEGITFY